MNERFENAKLYLIDLLRAYGHRPVIVKVRMDGEPVEVSGMFLSVCLSALLKVSAAQSIIKFR